MFIISLAMVYLFGRMLNLVRTTVKKNWVAILSLLSSYLFYFFVYDTKFELNQKIWNTLIYISISIIFYVLLGFKLYDRVDQLLDKVAADKPAKAKKK